VIKPRFLPTAEAELLKEVAYYSNVRAGLGIKFEHAVESAVKNAVANQCGGSPSPKGTRNLLLVFHCSILRRATTSAATSLSAG